MEREYAFPTFPTREVRQRLADIINQVMYSRILVGIERDGRLVAGVVPRDHLEFLDRLRAAATVDELVEALGHRGGEGMTPVVEPALTAALARLKDRPRGAERLCDLPKAVAARNPDGRVTAIEFADGAAIRDGYLNLTGAGDTVYLHGWIELADGASAPTLELSNGQRLEPARFTRDGAALSFHRFALDGEIDLELTLVRPPAPAPAA